MQNKKKKTVKVRDLKPKKDAKGGGPKPFGWDKVKEPHCGSIPRCGLLFIRSANLSKKPTNQKGGGSPY